MQAGQVALDRLPDDFQVHLVVAVGDTVSHRVHDLPGNVIVLRSELRSHTLDVVRRLADDLDVADHGVLHPFVVQERHLIHVRCLAVDAFDGFEDVPEVVRGA